MAYRHDPDLEFLGTLKSEELNDLVYLLTNDKDGDARWTEFLTSNEKYKRYYPDHSQYWQEIAEEIQLFGGNTFVNLFRGGRGVEYKEVLCDVCDKLKVNYNKYSSTQQIEQNLLMKILQDALKKMNPNEIQKLAMELDNAMRLKNLVDAALSPQAMAAIFIKIFNAGGFQSYQLTVIIANIISKALTGRGLALAGNAALVKVANVLTGPIGWAITALLTLFDIAGAAYRVTIPAVIQIIYLRSMSQNREAIEKADNDVSINNDTNEANNKGSTEK